MHSTPTTGQGPLSKSAISLAVSHKYLLHPGNLISYTDRNPNKQNNNSSITTKTSQLHQTTLYRRPTYTTMYTHQQKSPTSHIVAPCLDPKDLCPSCPTVMPSDICFDCGKLSKFLVTYPELEANQLHTGSTNSSPTTSHKRYTRLRRERKLEYRGAKSLVKQGAMSWQFDLDGGVREGDVRDTPELEVQDIIGSQSEDIHVYYDIWEEKAKDESTLLDDEELNLHYLGHDLMESLDEDLNLHYLGHNLMESLNMMGADNQFDAALLEDDDLGVRFQGRNLMDSLDMARDNQFDADDEESEYGDEDGSFAPSSFIVKMAQRCGTLQWEPSAPVERIPRKAQGLYNHLCEWNFADAWTPGARSGSARVGDDEVSPLDSGRKFSFEERAEEGFERGFCDGEGYASDSSEARVRNQLVECRRVVGGLAYEWDILL